MVNLVQHILFDHKTYLDANSIQNTFMYEWKDNECKINITFSVEDHLAISLPKAPYAGFNIEGSPSEGAIDKMTVNLMEMLAKRGVRRAIIRQKPEFESTSEFNLLHSGLVKNNFSYIRESNQFVPLQQDNKQNLHAMQWRKIKKCQQERLTFNKESISNLQGVHSFIASCRQQQDLEINIDSQSLQNLFDKLPSCYECYTVRNCEQKLVAASILVLVNNHMVYNYLPAFDRTFKSLSPLSFLLFRLYQVLKERDFKIFDLGISSVDGILQDGLYTYKKRMGATHSDRFIYELNLK